MVGFYYCFPDAGACLSVCIRIYPWTPYQKPDWEKTECLGEPLAAITVLSFNGNICVFEIQIVYLFLRAGMLRNR